jgi:hypothetical protein
MKAMRYWVTAGLITLVVLMSTGGANAQPGKARHVPFDEFIATTAAATFNPSAGKAADAAAFAEMRQHILRMYQGAHVTHSFTVGSQTYDCMPIDQQPAVRLHGSKGVAAPPPSAAAPGAGAAGANAGAQSGQAGASLFPKGVDDFGNTIGCEDKTVPIGRTTLEQINRFPNLRAFLGKGPDGKGQAPMVAAGEPGAVSAALTDRLTSNLTDGFVAPSPVLHKYNVTRQWVYNLGGNSTISINNPYVYTPWGEVFSLSQVWFAGYGSAGIQTVEAGWQVYPQRTGDEQPHLFGYYTADAYNTTGCYDYGCGAFFQYSGSVYLGAAFSPVSVPGGGQWETAIKYEYWYGNWWLQVGSEWVGYYPGWLFGSGEMATHSTRADFGAEIVGGDGTSYNYYPPMGSGQWGSSGWTWAAYQRQIWYFDSGWATHSASLGAMSNTCPGGTSTIGPYWGGSDWQIYFFFGGPAGWC